jgi:translation initiation factor IF-2
MDSGYDFTPPPEKGPEPQPAFAGGPPQPPPRPPKLTTRDLLEPGEPGKRIFVPDYIEIGDLAELLGVKPFKLVAELMNLRIFKHADEIVDFSTAAKVAQQHGFIVEKIL